MNKAIKKKLSIILTIILTFVCIPTLSAASVKINGGVDDIYETGGEGSATFDKTTNTLTLNGYDDKNILFDGFENETVNIVLKGINTISTEDKTTAADDEISGIDIINSSTTTLNITGQSDSKLNIKGYYNGIHNGDGGININNADIYGEDIYFVLIYVVDGGNVIIKNTTMETNTAEYVIANDNLDIEIDNVNYTSENIVMDDIYAMAKLTISNSKFDLKNNGNFILGTDTFIKNSTINADSIGILLDSDDMNIEKCNITQKNSYGALFGKNIVVKNSTINSLKGLSEEFYNYFIEKTEFIDSTVKMQSKGMIAFVEGKITIDNSIVSLESENSAALILIDDEKVDFGSKVVLKGVELKENKLIEGVTNTGDMFHYGYSYFKSKPAAIYTEENADKLLEILANELHFVKITNPETEDNFLIYILLSLTSLLGLIVLKKEI